MILHGGSSMKRSTPTTKEECWRFDLCSRTLFRFLHCFYWFLIFNLSTVQDRSKPQRSGLWQVVCWKCSDLPVPQHWRQRWGVQRCGHLRVQRRPSPLPCGWGANRGLDFFRSFFLEEFWHLNIYLDFINFGQILSLAPNKSKKNDSIQHRQKAAGWWLRWP